VAFQATTNNILNTLFLMFFHRFLPIMAFGTVHRSVGAVVATRALPMGIAMTHWEGMTIDTDIPPIAGIVAFGTLTGPVIGWTSMTGLAITLPTVIEIGWLPGIS
jgi:hypothetical protein